MLGALAQGLDEGKFGRVTVFVHDAAQIAPGLLPSHPAINPVSFAAPGLSRRMIGRIWKLADGIRAKIGFGRDGARQRVCARFGSDAARGAQMRALGIDLMIYPSPMAMSFEAGVPYITAVHDLQHRLQPEFKEVSADGRFEEREFVFGNTCRYANAILVDSEVGREDIIACYGVLPINPERVAVLPFVLPPSYEALATDAEVETIEQNDLPARFLFYPAQFWPHKNHRRIVEALVLLHRKGIDAPLVLVGGNDGALRAA
jgi:glycosyltransferase involved in cell wall biosynthesis